MCAIIDNDVRDEVFGAAKNPASTYFLDWLNNGKGRLVAGGQLLQELSGAENFKNWFQQALLSGTARRVPDDKVKAETDSLISANLCRSNDAHVLALARVSGARLLFTNDLTLRADFKNRNIIGPARGNIYSTLKNDDVDDTKVGPGHRSLLNSRRKFCSICN